MVNWAALAAGIVDKIFFYYAPKILAGTGSIPFALGAGYRHISEAAYVKVAHAAPLRRRLCGGRISARSVRGRHPSGAFIGPEFVNYNEAIIMFTGLVEEVGTIASIVERGGNHRITIKAPNTASELKQGNSVAVSGVCLTALDIKPESFCADLAAETWTRTSFSRITEGAQVNLELPLKADGRMGGHMVQGHVDGTGRFIALEPIPNADDFWLHHRHPRRPREVCRVQRLDCDRGH